MFALRIRVSMSAIGSVIVIGRAPSPRRLGHARDLARVGELRRQIRHRPNLRYTAATGHTGGTGCTRAP